MNRAKLRPHIAARFLSAKPPRRLVEKQQQEEEEEEEEEEGVHSEGDDLVSGEGEEEGEEEEEEEETTTVGSTVQRANPTDNGPTTIHMRLTMVFPSRRGSAVTEAQVQPAAHMP